MSEKTHQRAENPTGLCEDCAHARRIASAKGSQFILCELSQSDPQFAKYPRLPVLTCSGYTPKNSAPRTK
jgi:hypothetical protein